MPNRILNAWAAFILIAAVLLSPCLLIRSLLTRSRLVEVAAHGSNIPFKVDDEKERWSYEYWYPWPQLPETRVYKVSAPIKPTESARTAAEKRSLWIDPARPQEGRADAFGGSQLDLIRVEGHMIEEAPDEKGNGLGPSPVAPYAYAYPLPEGDISWHKGVDFLTPDNGRGAIQRCFVDSRNPAHSMLEKPKFTLVLSVTIITLILAGLYVCGKRGFGPLGVLVTKHGL